MRLRSVVGSIIIAVAAPEAATAQEAAATATVVAGPELSAGSLHRRVFGTGYRDLWTTEIEVPVLDLATEAGGLEPQFVVGRLQTLGLALRGQDGRSYTFRAVHKDLVRVLPEELRDTAVGDIAQDMLAASVPAGGLAAVPIAVAAGVWQQQPRLFVMPDSPLLGEFREQFAGLLGTLAEYPTAAPGGGTFGATEIIAGMDVFPLITASPDAFVDPIEFLRARLVDALLGDWDRHIGQWRFARVPGRPGLVPVAEDRDQAFAQYEGIAVSMARDREPKFNDFSADYPDLEGLSWNARSLDRRFLVGLSIQDWIAVAEDIQRRLTDEVLADAVAHLPAPYVDLAGEEMLAKLIARRDSLQDLARAHYEFLAGEVNVFGTDTAEIIRIERFAAGTTSVSIAPRDPGAADICSGSSRAAAHYSRDFLPHETRSLRVFTGAGDDVVIAIGVNGGGPRVRLIGGGGNDVLCDVDAGEQYEFDISSAGAAGPGRKVGRDFWLSPAETIADAGTPESSQGSALKARRDWGSTSYGLPVFGYGPDVGPVLGHGIVFETYGFRRRPYAAQHQLRGAIAFGAASGRLDYTGIYRRESRRQFFIVRGLASGIETLRYHGFGNETIAGDDADFFRIRQRLLAVEGRAAFWAGPNATLTAGAIARFTRTEEEDDDFISLDRPYGIEDIGQAGLVAGFNFNNHTRPDQREMKGSDDALRFGPAELGVGYTVDVNAHFYPKFAGKLRENYGFVHAEATASYLLGSRGPAILFRLGGATTWGETPYYDAARLGSAQLRGLRPDRFAGRQSLYGNAAAFFYVGHLSLIVPGRWGVLGRGGIGRVWVPDEVSDKWHTSVGGGLWWSPWDVRNAVRLEVSASEESTLFYMLLGFGF